MGLIGQALILISASVLVLHAQETETDASRAVRTGNDLNCFVNGDLEACTAELSSDGSRDADEVYLQYGCTEAKQSSFCIKLGNWYSRRSRRAEAASAFAQGCDLKDRSACLQLVNVKVDTARAGVAPDQLAPILSEAKAAFAKACTLKAQSGLSDCQSAARMIEEASKLDRVKTCEVHFWRVPAEDKAPISGVMHAPLSLQPECLKRCADLTRGYKTGEQGARRIRGQCFFDGKSLGPEIWQELNVASECTQQMTIMQVGNHEVPFYEKCYCLSLAHSRVNLLIQPLGYFATAGVSTAKGIGSMRYYRCSLRLNWTDPETMSKNPALCRQNFKTLQKQLQQAVPPQSYDLNLTGVKCTR